MRMDGRLLYSISVYGINTMNYQNGEHMTDENATTKTLIQKMGEFSKKLSKGFGEGKVKAEENIKKHPLPYVTGTLVGGVLIGYLVTRKRTK